jgi:DNA mismatch repair protein MutL
MRAGAETEYQRAISRCRKVTGQRRFFQVKNRYIMCHVISGIMMIDQKRAHERVLYEKYLASLDDGRNLHRYRFPGEVELNGRHGYH